MDSLVKIILVVVVVAVLLMIGPWLAIWSINTLMAAAMVGAPAGAFVPHIAFGFWTWLAAALLFGLGIFATRKG
jgi:hypothetical protein